MEGKKGASEMAGAGEDSGRPAGLFWPGRTTGRVPLREAPWTDTGIRMLQHCGN
jgi:hypothetical protein